MAASGVATPLLDHLSINHLATPTGPAVQTLSPTVNLPEHGRLNTQFDRPMSSNQKAIAMVTGVI